MGKPLDYNVHSIVRNDSGVGTSKHTKKAQEIQTTANAHNKALSSQKKREGLRASRWSARP